MTGRALAELSKALSLAYVAHYLRFADSAIIAEAQVSGRGELVVTLLMTARR